MRVTLQQYFVIANCERSETGSNRSAAEFGVSQSRRSLLITGLLHP
ncbi:MAG: hypothetical protein LBH30_05505 [Prevotellaceae bacterium]|nr:hypothetical protein [Prevotellaceae bacterium]